MYAADAAREGITAASGSGIAHLEVTAAQQKAGTIHSKLLKMWALKPPETSWRDDARRRLERLPNDSPAGVYAASFYLPPDYVKSAGDWTNIFQFKESYLDPNGTWHQDPQWWLNLTRADDWSPEIRPAGSSRGDPVILASHWRATEERPGQVVAVPRGRWFEIKADLYPSNRIDWYIDGNFFESSPASRYPVGISKRRAVGWSFGVGHYGGVGKLWVDDVSFTSR